MASWSARAEAETATMGGSGVAEILPGRAPASAQASSSTPPGLSGNAGSVAEQIRQSQRHWSELSDWSSIPVSKKPFESVRNLAARVLGGGGGGKDRATRRSRRDRAVAMDNRKLFMELQSHPSWGDFFRTFDYTLETAEHVKPVFCDGSDGLLRIGEKFAEGAQGELFHVHVRGRYAHSTESIPENGVHFVTKVFKKGTLLRDLQSQWPLGYLQFVGERIEEWKSSPGKVYDVFFVPIVCGILLEDGRFAFVMQRCVEDLKRRIECNMVLQTIEDCGPFSLHEVESIMWWIAKGMDWFHRRNIIHRDLKASNVLVAFSENGFEYLIADYECSVGVVGTNFFRAPEILQACKDRCVSQKPELFTKAVDVYSYGMTCYEILTGRLPFEGHPTYDYDHVINGHRPELPPHVDGWICDLLRRCWDANPLERPSFGEILSIVVANSVVVQKLGKRYESANED